MATQNLISKSLGDVLVQSGNGTPNHTASIGSYYTNKDTGTLHTNVDGSTGWDALNRVSYGEQFIQGNTSQTSVGVAGTWYATSALAWTEGNVNGITMSAGTLVVGTGRGGRYEIIATATLDYVAASDYEIGVSKNSGNPATGMYQGGTLLSTVPTACVTVNGYVDLVEGDTLELGVRNINNTSNVIVKHGGIIANRIGD